jgi:LPS O-antigen subunit length determinant protein (WzzB/FepE family)
MEQYRSKELESSRFDQFEDEIELMDYLKVLWKWKYLILVGTLICAAGATVVSLNMTKVYGISTVLQPGILKVSEDGKKSYIDSPQNIKALIETGSFNEKVLGNITIANKEVVPKSIGFKATIPKGTNALDVLYETTDVDLGLEIMKKLNTAIFERYQTLIKRYQENYDSTIRSKSSEAFKLNERVAKAKHAISTVEAENEAAVSELLAKTSTKRAEISTVEAENEAAVSQILTTISAKGTEISTVEAEKQRQISQIVNKISSKTIAISAAGAEKEEAIKKQFNRKATIMAQIEAKKKQILNLGKRISDVEVEIGRINNNTNLLIEDRNKLLSSTKKDQNILASVMYTNTIQQNISYLNTLRSTMNNINHQVFQERVGIEKLQNNIKDLEAQEDNLKKQTKYKIENLQADIKDLEAQEDNLKKLTKYKIENLQADTKDLEAQKGNMAKLTKYKVETLQADIKDLEAQKGNMAKLTKYKVDSIKSEIKDLESEKKYVLEEIKSIEFGKNNIQNIQIIQAPKSGISPIKPKTRLNVMLAGVVGLFLTVFLAFFIEYVSKHKNREQD